MRERGESGGVGGGWGDAFVFVKRDEGMIEIVRRMLGGDGVGRRSGTGGLYS